MVLEIRFQESQVGRNHVSVGTFRTKGHASVRPVAVKPGDPPLGQSMTKKKYFSTIPATLSSTTGPDLTPSSGVPPQPSSHVCGTLFRRCTPRLPRAGGSVRSGLQSRRLPSLARVGRYAVGRNPADCPPSRRWGRCVSHRNPVECPPSYT